MTGANFAVAETGAIVTVTNVGNADLSGDVPKVRICSFGIEKIIPSNRGLALFIRLLSRRPPDRRSRYLHRTPAPRAKTGECT
jgi:L-lactate dehydrogenase complex protein LldF